MQQQSDNNNKPHTGVDNHTVHKHTANGPYEAFVKRILDLTLSLIAIIILSPVMLITAILVRIKLGSPVLFMQERPGMNEKIFRLYKFRSMTDKRDSEGNLLPDAERLTRFGRILRSTSLDELPELINVLKGQMSLIGPRPLLTKYIPLYNEFQHRRHEVKPGLTGYAQAYGRNGLSWDEKFEKDVYYVDHVSFIMDLKILFKTVAVVLKRDGINQAGESATMEPFMGNGQSSLGQRGEHV